MNIRCQNSSMRRFPSWKLIMGEPLDGLVQRAANQDVV